MKSAFELALERTGGKLQELSPEKKEKIAEIDRKYQAKIAETRLGVQERLAKESDPAKIKLLEESLVTDLASLQDKCEREKEKIRNGK